MTIRRTFKIVGALLGVGLILLIATVSVLGWQHPTSVTLPEPTGPYSVGRTSFNWIDNQRIDPFAPTPGTNRELPVWIWYPAESDGSLQRVDYLPEPVRNALAQRSDSNIFRFVSWLVGTVSTDPSNVLVYSFDAAPMARGEATFPVVLMKPAIGFLALQHTSLAENLASHGYVVVASDSPFTTPIIVYEDGRIVRRTDAGRGRLSDSQSSGIELNEPHPLAPGQPNGAGVPVVQAWADDEHFLLERLASLNTQDSSGLFLGRLDLESVGAFGHSFGGATALQFCSDDARCKAGIDIDGAVVGEVVRSGMAKPFLFIFSDRPEFTRSDSEQSPEASALLDAIERIRTRLPNQPNQIIIEGTRHFNFTDNALLHEPHIFKMLGAYGPIDGRRAFAVTNRYVRAFFDTHLKGMSDSLLAGPSAEYPEVRFD